MTKSQIYKLLKISNDLNAVAKGKVVKRVIRSKSGSIMQKLFNKIFR